MKRALVVIALVIVGLSCLVDRRSDDFDCDDSSDCDDLGVGEYECNDNFCEKVNCPTFCDAGCLPGKICNKTCNTNNECMQGMSGVSCPSGYTCNFTCSTDCSVTCALGCAITCIGAVCDIVSCGSGATCTCMGTTCQ